MASSLAPWLHKTLLKYSNTNGTDLEPFVGGVRVQILKWHSLESPFWASVGDQDYSIFARFSDESAAELLSTYDKRITSLKTSIVKIKSFRPLLVRPYEVSDKLELALFVDKFEQLGMDDEEVHFRETRTPLSACGGLLGEWIVKLRELHPNSKNGSDPTPSLSLKRSRASTEEAEPAVEDSPFVPPPVPLESAAPSGGLRIDPSLPELTVAEYLGSCWWNIAKKEQRKQDEQPDFLADVSDTDASVARELARDKEVTAVAPALEPKPQRRRSPSSSSASSSEDEEITVKPNRKLLASPLSPMPTSSPPRNQNQARSPSHSPTPPSSSRTATHSSPPSQERPLRKSRTLSAALGASSGKNSLRSDGSMVLVEASDEEGEEEESPDKLADAFLLSSGEPLFPAGRRSRMESPSTKQPLSSSGTGAEHDDFEGDRSQSRSQEDHPVATFTSEIEGEGASSSKRREKEITSSNATSSTSSSGIRKRQDGRDGRPNKMMRRTGPTADELEPKGSLTSLAGGPIELEMQGSASGSGTKGTGSSDERRRAFEAAGDEAMEVEEEEEVEEVGRSPRSSITGEEILSRVGRDGEESGSLEESLSWERKGGGSKPVRQLEKDEEETQEDEVEQLEEVEMEQAEEEEEVGSLTQVEEEESFEHVVKTEPLSSPMKQGHPQTPRRPSTSSPRHSPPPPAPRPISPTPDRRDRRGQAPPPSSGAFQQSSAQHPASSSPPHQTLSQVAPTPIPAIQWQKRVRSPTATPTDPLPPPPAPKSTATRLPAASTTQRFPSPPIKSLPKSAQTPIQGPSKSTVKVVASTSNGKAPVVPGPPAPRRFSPPPPPLPSRVGPSPSTSKPTPLNPVKAASHSPPLTSTTTLNPSTFSTATPPPPPPPKRKAAAKSKSSSIYDPSKDPFAAKKPTAYRRISSTFTNEGASSRRSSTSLATPRSPSVAGRGEAQALPQEETESPARAAVVASDLPFAREVKIESPSSRRIVAGGEGASSSRGKEGVAAAGRKASVVKKVATTKMERWELHLSPEKEVGGLSEEECREVSRLVSGGL